MWTRSGRSARQGVLSQQLRAKEVEGCTSQSVREQGKSQLPLLPASQHHTSSSAWASTTLPSLRLPPPGLPSSLNVVRGTENTWGYRFQPANAAHASCRLLNGFSACCPSLKRVPFFRRVRGSRCRSLCLLSFCDGVNCGPPAFKYVSSFHDVAGLLNTDSWTPRSLPVDPEGGAIEAKILTCWRKGHGENVETCQQGFLLTCSLMIAVVPPGRDED